MRVDTATEQHPSLDSSKAAGALVLGALAVLVILSRAFRPVLGG